MQGWAHDQGVDLTTEVTEQLIHECETCTTIKQVQGGKAPLLWRTVAGKDSKGLFSWGNIIHNLSCIS